MSTQRILLVDDDGLDRKTVVRALKTAGWQGEVVEAMTANEAKALFAEQRFDCVLLDYRLPDSSGLQVLDGFARSNTAPVVMLTGEGNELVAVDAMKHGASDYLPKHLLTPDILSRTITLSIERHQLQTELEKARLQIEHMALYDLLTELGNRGLFMRDLTHKIASAARSKGSFYILMMDLDRFKAANDTYGHEAGDAVLKEVGRRLVALNRSTDLFYRLGGDEFTAIIEAPDREALLPITTRIARGVAESIGFDVHHISVGCSIGAARYPVDGATPDALLHAADAAMYRAKKSGNGIALAEEL